MYIRARIYHAHESSFYHAASVEINPRTTLPWHTKMEAVRLSQNGSEPWPAFRNSTCHHRPYRDTKPGDIIEINNAFFFYEGPWEFKETQKPVIVE